MSLAILIAAIGSAGSALSGHPAEVGVFLVLLLMAFGLGRIARRLDRLDERLDDIDAVLVVK